MVTRMSSVSIEDLIRHYSLEEKQLDGEIPSEYFSEIAIFLSDWQLLAPVLGIDVSIVERDNIGEELKRIGLLKCLKRKLAMKATFRVLISALLSIERANEAGNVCELLKDKKGKGPSCIQPHSTAADQVTRVEDSPLGNKFPCHLQEGNLDDLMARLELESRRMTERFTVLVAHTRTALKEQEITVDDLILIVRNLHHLKEGRNKLLNELKKLKERDITKALDLMSDYWSFFDYDLLKTIIDSYNGNQMLKEEFDLYHSHFKEYCKRRLHEVPRNAFNGGTSMRNFKIKLDDVFTVPIEKIRELKIRLSSILDTTICLIGFERGCIELTYASMHELDAIFPLSDQQKYKISQTDILKIYHHTEIYYEEVAIADTVSTVILKATADTTPDLMFMTQLILTNSNIDDEKLADSLRHNTALREISLSTNHITDDGARALADCLRYCTQVQMLDLSFNHIGDTGAMSLAKSLELCTDLCKLDFTCNQIGDQGAVALAESTSNIKDLKFSIWNHKITKEGATAVMNYRSSSNLDICTFEGTGIGATKVDIFAINMQDSPEYCVNVTTLNLDCNNIVPDGAKALADSLQHCSNLQTLNLNYNNIGSDGAKALADGLKHCNNLQTLNLRSNSIGSDGAKALVDCLKNLQTLNLNFNISEELHVQLVTHHKKLLQMHISAGQITSTETSTSLNRTSSVTMTEFQEYRKIMATTHERIKASMIFKVTATPEIKKTSMNLVTSPEDAFASEVSKEMTTLAHKILELLKLGLSINYF